MPFSSDILIGAIFGFIISLPIALFLAFWMSAVKNRIAVVIGALLGAIIGVLVLLFWAGNMTNPAASGVSVFFGSALFCSAAGLIGGIIFDLIIGRLNSRHYRRTLSHEA